MHQNYRGLPAARNVEQAIISAQLLILRGLERGAAASCEPKGTLAERMSPQG
jgi:hypothetical protein